MVQYPTVLPASIYDEAGLVVPPSFLGELLAESIKGRVSSMVNSLPTHSRIGHYGGVCKVAKLSHTGRFFEGVIETCYVYDKPKERL